MDRAPFSGGGIVNVLDVSIDSGDGSLLHVLTDTVATDTGGISGTGTGSGDNGLVNIFAVGISAGTTIDLYCDGQWSPGGFCDLDTLTNCSFAGGKHLTLPAEYHID